MALTFAVGQRWTAAAAQSLADAVGTNYVKGVATGRASTTTLADDPTLSAIPLAVGTWEIEVVGNWVQLTTNTQKIQTQWAFTGTWANSIRSCTGPGAAQTAATNAVTDSTMTGASFSGGVTYSSIAGTSYSTFREISSNVIVSVAGNFSLQWAQAVSSVNNTQLQEASFVRVRKLS